jgi:hypothetical protein
MGRPLSPFIHVVQSIGSDLGLTLKHRCPGCKSYHLINVEKPNYCGSMWSWNENPDCPTFRPSINIVGVCHYRITEGQITYCSDSVHELSGKTVELPRICDVFPEDLEHWNDLDFSS